MDSIFYIASICISLGKYHIIGDREIDLMLSEWKNEIGSVFSEISKSKF